ncbi:MAG: hypothetical protein PHX78_01260 [bacterium]|nr:hypothetical protein [bacterium]
MNKTKTFLTHIFLILVLITVYGISSVYSEDNHDDPARTENSYLVGRVYKNNAHILFNGVSVNEFILANNCGECSFEYCFFAPSKEIKKFLLNSAGKQVILSGKYLSIPADKLKQENPASKCLETPVDKSISFFSVEKAEYISFYSYVVPDKINWDKPVNIKLHIKNPFEYQITLNIDLFSLDSHSKENHILKAKEEKDIKIDFNLSKQDWARDYGAAIILEIKTSSGKEKSLIYFSDKIAFYGPDGELINLEE